MTFLRVLQWFKKLRWLPNLRWLVAQRERPPLHMLRDRQRLDLYLINKMNRMRPPRRKFQLFIRRPLPAL